jgi:hypothetical protein
LAAAPRAGSVVHQVIDREWGARHGQLARVDRGDIQQVLNQLVHSVRGAMDRLQLCSLRLVRGIVGHDLVEHEAHRHLDGGERIPEIV